MVSPRIKALPSASPSPATETSKRRILSSRRGNGGDNATEKGSYSGYVDKMRSSPPPTPIPVHFISEMLDDSVPDVRDVIGFREAGFMGEKDKDALDHSSTKLQSEELLAKDIPRIKALPPAPPSPKIETSKHRVLSSRKGAGSRITNQKGNSSGYIDRMRSQPHTPLPVHFETEMLEDCTPNTHDVIGFRDAGFMYEATMVTNDKEALEDSATKSQFEELLATVTPRIKAIPSASPSPTIETSKRRVLSSRRGDGSKITDRIGSQPHTPLSGHFVSEMLEDCTPDTRDVIDFREAGFMDETTLVRKDKEALEDSVTKLQSELYDYQLNMGHLLINKADLITQCDDLKHHLEETEESLKRERSAHLIDLREAEDRMDSLREALFLEKQTVINLERDLFGLNPDNSSLSKETIEEKTAGDFLHNPDFNDIDKLLSADIHLPEMENPESVPKMEKKDHHPMIINPREDIQEWENELQEREHKLFEGLQNLNEMEEKAKKSQISLDEMEQLCKKTHEEIRLDRMDLNKKENDVNHKLAEISVKEQEIENLKKSLDKREKDLLTFEENINIREKVGIESVLEEHRSLLEKNEMEIEKRKASVEKQCLEILDSAEKKELEISHLMDELLQRQHSLDAKAEHLREKDELAAQLIHSLEDKKDSLEAEEKALSSEKETLLGLRLQLESQQAASVDLEVTLQKEQLLLTAATKERSDQSLILENLKQEFENLVLEKMEISRIVEEKRMEKEILEREVTELSEQKTAVVEEIGVLTEEKKRFVNERAVEMEDAKQTRNALEVEKAEMTSRNKLLEVRTEELRILAEKVEVEKAEMTLRQKILEDTTEEVRILKEKVENEKAEMTSRQKILEDSTEEVRILKAKVENEKAEMTSRKKILEDSTEEVRILKAKVENEKAKMTSKKKILKDSTEEVRILKEKVENEKAEMTSKKKILENSTEELRILKEKAANEKAEMTSKKKILEEDTEELMILKEKLEDEKAAFLEERGRFLSFLEKHEMCSNCSRVVREFSKFSGGKVRSEPRTGSLLHECTASAMVQKPEVPEASMEGEEKVAMKTRAKKNTVVMAQKKQTGAAEDPVTVPSTDNVKRKRVRESTEDGEGSVEAEARAIVVRGRLKKQAVEPAENRYNLRTPKSGVTTRAQKKKT